MSNSKLIHSLTDKNTVHSYLPFYEALTLPYREIDCTIVEVGAQWGGSLLLWRHLLPNAKIFGIDIADSLDQQASAQIKLSNTKLLVGDAYQPSMITRLPGSIDIAIDDGPHTLHSQMAFLDLYLPLLSQGGTAIIEDIQETHWIRALTDNLPEGFSAEVVDLRHVKGRYDDILFVVKKTNQ